MIDYTFYNWGPLLLKFNLTEEELERVRTLSDVAHEDFSDKLAGRLKQQLKIENKQSFLIWNDILLDYFDVYIDVAYSQWYQNMQNRRPNRENLKLEFPLWINHMYANDYNPIHTHSKELSFVLYTEIPDGMLGDPEMYENRAASSPPGSIDFVYSSTDGRHDLKPIVSHNVCPQAGELYVFPAYLPHMVTPFKCDGVRKSISGNVFYE